MGATYKEKEVKITFHDYGDGYYKGYNGFCISCEGMEEGYGKTLIEAIENFDMSNGYQARE